MTTNFSEVFSSFLEEALNAPLITCDDLLSSQQLFCIHRKSRRCAPFKWWTLLMISAKLSRYNLREKSYGMRIVKLQWDL